MSPRLLKTEDAARYVSLSVSAFRTQVAPWCRKLHPVAGRVAWLRDDLDAWIDRLAGIEHTPTTMIEARINPLDALP
ncbi:transcriptional regulator [Asaia siamensis]